MKTLISVIFGLISAIGIFMLDNILIMWILSHIHNPDLYWIIKLICWVLAVAWTGGLAIGVAFVVGIVVKIMLD